MLCYKLSCLPCDVMTLPNTPIWPCKLSSYPMLCYKLSCLPCDVMTLPYTLIWHYKIATYPPVVLQILLVSARDHEPSCGPMHPPYTAVLSVRNLQPTIPPARSVSRPPSVSSAALYSSGLHTTNHSILIIRRGASPRTVQTRVQPTPAPGSTLSPQSTLYLDEPQNALLYSVTLKY